MKATIDVPDALYRRMKARAALDGRAVRDVTIELYERWLQDRSSSPEATGDAMDQWLERWQELGKEVQRASIEPRPLSEIIRSERR